MRDRRPIHAPDPDLLTLSWADTPHGRSTTAFGISRSGNASRAELRREGGFSMLEILVAIVLLTVISLASWSTINSTLALMGSTPSWKSQKTARLWTIAGGWVQAELEYAKQLGYGGACGGPPCTIWVQMSGSNIQVSADNCATWASSVAPFSGGPALPTPDFPEGRIIITTDPNAPTDPYSGSSYLQDIEVDVFSRIQSNCTSPTPYSSAYTAVGIR
jgi:prepilin-type N-terminal cleavage/methylation domain-containing protein